MSFTKAQALDSIKFLVSRFDEQIDSYKKWKRGNIIGRPEIQKFVGALAGQGAKKGIFIRTSAFTKEAIDYAPKNETKIVLINGIQLSQLMIDYNIGCSLHQSYEIKKLDSDYFDE